MTKKKEKEERPIFEEAKKEEPTLYTIGLGEAINMGGLVYVRVPGGWLSILSQPNVAPATAFIPYSPEFLRA